MSYQFTQTGEQLQALVNRLSPVPLVKDEVTVSSLPVTISKIGITPKHEVVEFVLGEPTVQTGEWTVETGDGEYTIRGEITGETTLTLKFACFAE